MSENPNRNYELDQNIIPPCESGIKDECTKYNPPKERYELHDKNILFDENGFKGYGIYEIQGEGLNEDTAEIVVQLLIRKGEDIINEDDLEKNLRYTKGIDEIGKIELKKGEIISIEEGDTCSYVVNIGKNKFVINTHQFIINKIK